MKKLSSVAFSPEFRNRLDAVIRFSHLSQDIVMQVVHKFIIKLEDQLSEKNVSISLSDDAVHWLANKGYDKLMGARPLSRLIQEEIKKPLADELLFGKLSKGGSVHITTNETDDTLSMIFESKIVPKSQKRKVRNVKNKSNVTAEN